MLHSRTERELHVHPLGLLRWRAARVEHFLQQVELNSSSRLVFANRNVRQKISVTNVTGVAVSVSVDHPFPLGQVGVTSPVVLGLEMLHLGEDVVTIAHLRE